MKILVVVSGQMWLGGLTIQTALLCRELERLGHRVAVIAIGAEAVVDQFRHARVRWGPDEGRTTKDERRRTRWLRSGQPSEESPDTLGESQCVLGPSSFVGGPRAAESHADDQATSQGVRRANDDYVFRYEVVADAARYLPPGPPAVRAALSPIVRLGMAIVAPPADGRAPLNQARGAAASFVRGVTAALDAGLSGGAADAPFLSRLLLRSDRQDLDRIEAIRDWFQPDVEYACDLALVPMMARLRDRGIPLVAAAQGFEIIQRRGVGVVDALRASSYRLDLVLSGSQANIEENLNQLGPFVDGAVPAHTIPYGVALDGGWELDRAEAVRRLRELEQRLSVEERGAGGLWGDVPGAPHRGHEPPFIITCLSRIDVEKGTDLALHALSILRSQGVPVRLWIAGNAMPGSAFLDVVRSKIRLMDLGAYVSLIGTVEDVLDKVAFLRASDAFAAGFIRSEPFGLVYTEAFAAGLPVVAPATGAAPELMRYLGDTSTLYPPNDTGALAARLAALYRSPDARTALAERERRAFLERFNAVEMAKAAACEFEEVIRARRCRLHAS